MLLTLSTLSQARAAQSGTDVAPSTTKPEAPQPSYLEPLNADEFPDAHRKDAPPRSRAHQHRHRGPPLSSAGGIASRFRAQLDVRWRPGRNGATSSDMGG